MTFSQLLNEWFELKQRGPQDSGGYTDKAYWNRLAQLEKAMDQLVKGAVHI